MTVRVIDIETTGTDPAADAIIEIASVDLAREGGIANPMQTFINPGRPIPLHISGVHHIIDEDVASAPTLVEVVDRFRGADVYVAHNAKFEQDFIAAHSIDLRPIAPQIEPTWICTLKCALRLFPDWPSHTNQSLRYQLGIVRPFNMARDSIHPHRADSDVIVTAAILTEMMRLARWSTLVGWSQQPPLHTRFTFGMHKGKRFDEAPRSYLEWIINKSEMEDAKESARFWLGLPCNITA